MPEDFDIHETGHMRLVLVHLGAAQAEHLWLNMKSILKRFPKIEITFISDRYHQQLPVDSRVSFFQYQRTEVDRTILTNLEHDSKFRSGFWHFTIERFLALEQYHQRFPWSKVLHIESDILLLPNFPFVRPKPEGMNIWLTTPAFLAIFMANWFDVVVVLAGLSALLISLPAMIYTATGWVQFGYRYALDYFPFLFLAITSGLQRMPKLLAWILVVLSVLINIWGVYWEVKLGW